MPIGLTHLGEAIVQSLIERQPSRFLELCGLPHSNGFGGRTLREAQLRPYAAKRFDGASRIDLIAPLHTGEALPIEVKLGETRLSKTRIDTEWLSGCRPSHYETRWAGNMMSILERTFPPGTPPEPLIAHAAGTDYPLTIQWCIVVRQSTADSWIDTGRPNFSNAMVVSFDDLVSHVGSTEFDTMVRELLSFPYYDTWISGA